MTTRPPVLLGVLAALALAVGLATSPQVASAIPSVENNGPHGLGVLAAWLRAQAVDVRVLAEALDASPLSTGVLVIAAPTARRITQHEVDALARFVSGGGTLVYLAPRTPTQPVMAEWLGLSPGPFLSADLTRDDPTGATVEVALAAGALHDATSLRLSADRTVTVADAAPVTSPSALWFKPMGTGAVWVAPGADLAESARLDQFDNARFWRRLAATGPVTFDEFHHRAEAASLPATSLWAMGAQVLFCAALFLWAHGRRLGPARPTLPTTHRASVEYVHALAGLADDARVDGEVIEANRKEARAVAADRLGLSTTLPIDELVLALETRVQLAPEVTRTLFESDDVVAVSMALARLQRAAGVLGPTPPRPSTAA